MDKLVSALEFVRDRLLVAMTHLQRDETEDAKAEIEAATDRLRELREVPAALEEAQDSPVPAVTAALSRPSCASSSTESGS